MIDPVTPEQRAALRVMAPALPVEAYLAGGVAIAATLRHRTSRDLDFFVPAMFDEERWVESFTGGVEGVRITSVAPGTVYAELGTVPVSVIAYRYPLLVAPHLSELLDVRVASLEDLACMKLSAIASRGMARDFWDLYGLLGYGVARGDLGQALELYRKKFVADDIGHVVRSLVYFGDADASPLPGGLTDVEWTTMKGDFQRWVTALT